MEDYLLSTVTVLILWILSRFNLSFLFRSSWNTAVLSVQTVTDEIKALSMALKRRDSPVQIRLNLKSLHLTLWVYHCQDRSQKGYNWGKYFLPNIQLRYLQFCYLRYWGFWELGWLESCQQNNVLLRHLRGKDVKPTQKKEENLYLALLSAKLRSVIEGCFWRQTERTLASFA